MKQIEAEIANVVRNCARGKRATGRVECEACDEGVGFTSNIQSLFEDHEFPELLRRSVEISRASDLGPWYRCNIELSDSGTVAFEYFWEETPFACVKEVQPGLGGHVPRFVFRKRFDKELVDSLSDFDVDVGLAVHVVSELQRGKPVSDGLMDLYATADWQCDVDNGELNQYFERERDPTTRLPRVELYPRTLRGLTRIGHRAGTSLYSEAIGLYAHFYPRVEDARKTMGLPSVERQDRSDIMSRYWDMRDSIEATRVRYVRDRFEECMMG